MPEEINAFFLKTLNTTNNKLTENLQDMYNIGVINEIQFIKIQFEELKEKIKNLNFKNQFKEYVSFLNDIYERFDDILTDRQNELFHEYANLMFDVLNQIADLYRKSNHETQKEIIEHAKFLVVDFYDQLIKLFNFKER